MGKLNIYKRKDGRFEGRIYEITDGRRTYTSFYGKTREAVEKKLYASCIVFQPEFNTVSITVKDLFNEWIQVMSTRIKESTMSNYCMKAQKHLIPEFGDEQCSQVKRQRIYSFINLKIKEGLSLRYISDIIVLLKSIYKYAHTEYGIKNVTDGIVMPKKCKPDVRILTNKEQKALIRYINDNTNDTTIGAAVSLYTGMRLGEICALKWKDIDLKKRLITVNKTMQRIQQFDGCSRTKLIISEPKSSSSKRVIPIPECLIKLLRNNRCGDDCYILSSCDKPVEPRTMQYRFAKLLKNANLPSVHFHSLRHAFATRSIAIGFDVKTLSEILGHSSIEMTLNRYVHSSLERKRDCMNKLYWA